MDMKFDKLTPFKIWIILILLMVVVHPVKAGSVVFSQTLTSSGTNTITDTVTTTGAGLTGGATGSDSTIAHLYANFNNVKRLASIEIPAFNNLGGGPYASGMTLTANANNIVRKGVVVSATVDGKFYGSGSIGWFRQGGNVSNNTFYYEIIFDTINNTLADSLTGTKEIILTYDTSVYTNYIQDYGFMAGAPAQQNINAWNDVYAQVNIDTSNAITTHTISTFPGVYIIEYSFSETASLTVNQLSNIFAYVNLTKNTNNLELNTKDSNGNLIYDATSTADEIQLTNIGAGLDINNQFMINHQWFNFSVFSSAGFCFPNCIPVVPPPAGGQVNPPLTIPSSGGSIQFHQTKYSVGDSPSIEWAISNDEWGCFFCSAWLIEIKDDNGNTIAGRWALGAQTGNRSILSYQAGTWTATLTKGALFPEVIGTATTVVQSSANTEDTITISKPVYNTTDIITVSGYKLSPYPGWIAISPYDSPYNYVRTYGTTVDFTGITGGTLLGNYTYSTALGEGKFLAQLHIGNGQSPAIKEVIFSVNSSGNFYIFWNSADQFGNHFLPGFTGEFFAITYSSKTPSDIISITSPKGNIYDTWTVSNYPGQHQIFITGSTDNLGTWSAKIQNASNVSDYSIGVITLVQPGTIGNNNNITLMWTPSTVVVNNHVILSWYNNNVSNYRIAVSSSGVIFSNQTYLNTASGSLDFVFKSSGSYYAIMSNETDGGLLKQVVLIVTSTSIVPTATPTPSTGNQASAKTTQVSNLLSSDVFWALIIISGLTIFIAKETRKKQ